ncbi:MAG: aldehyde dehydrogenase family protein, partial [Cyanobacteria bacterium REEB65]|nr:aldehyde dehydrogenase family protein [Cyanobacteria bacterium REEB65]
FVEALAHQARKLRSGDPYDEATTLGPLISAAHRDKVTAFFDGAREQGAKTITGGHKATLSEPWNGGFFVEPTLWTGLDDDATCVREEIFGPVCHIAPFDTEEEAVARANQTDYGLAAVAWTQDLSRAHRISQQLEAGITWINTWYLRDLRTPFGGLKASGIGREGGRHSLDFYSEVRNVCIKL